MQSATNEPGGPTAFRLHGEHFVAAVKHAREWLEDPATEIVATGRHGIVLRKGDMELSIHTTRREAFFRMLPHVKIEKPD